MKVVLVHDWLTGMRGGERVLESLCEMFPGAPVYTLLRRTDWRPKFLEGHTVHASWLQKFPAVATRYRYYLPLFPRAIEALKIEPCDLVVSSSHCVAKGILVPRGVPHLAYIHAPMRYMWDQYDAYFGKGRAPWWVRMGAQWARKRLQEWDVRSNERVTHWVANSRFTAERIKQWYRREAEVVYPPVDVERFLLSDRDDGFYLMVSALVPYKRVEQALDAFRDLPWPLKIVGEGPERRRLERRAGPRVEFLGWQPDEVVREYYARCRALIFPGEEDFGLVPVEAMASGKPVIAWARGGARETVVPFDRTGASEKSPTGVWYESPTASDLAQAVHVFETHRHAFYPEAIRRQAMQFSRVRFRERMERFMREQVKIKP